MPAGLDGNPDPIVTPARSALLDELGVHIAAVRPGQRLLVGIDGASGTGKSTMADELAVRIEAGGRQVLRGTVDSFHRPRAERLAQGANSATGYYRDSHQFDTLVRQLLEPFVAGAVRLDRAAFDEPSDSPASDVVEGLVDDSVLLFDGLFLHRPALAQHWHLSLYLRSDQRRRRAWDTYWAGNDPELAERRRHRYFDGQALYEAEAAPAERATWVIDNDDLASPRLIRSVTWIPPNSAGSR